MLKDIFMSVLKPKVVWIDRRCFRFFESMVWGERDNMASYMEDNDEFNQTDEELCDTDIEIVPNGYRTVQLDNETKQIKKYKHTFFVPKPYFRFIVGPKDTVRRRIQENTKTQIFIPYKNQTGHIEIVGEHCKGIVSARNQIDLIVEASKKKIPYTHFVSIPINDDKIITNFNAFKENVLKNYGDTSRGVDETIFQIPNKLHLTIVMLCLLNDEEIDKSINALHECHEKIIRPYLEQHGPIDIQLKGVNCMNDDPANVRVLYASVVTRDDILQILVDNIAQYFDTNIKLKKEDFQNNVKMHMTLLNERYRQTDKSYGKNNDTFDATNILQVHKDTVFGEVRLREIHISKLHAYGENGYYEVTAKINCSDECKKVI